MLGRIAFILGHKYLIMVGSFGSVRNKFFVLFPPVFGNKVASKELSKERDVANMP